MIDQKFQIEKNLILKITVDLIILLRRVAVTASLGNFSTEKQTSDKKTSGRQHKCIKIFK